MVGAAKSIAVFFGGAAAGAGLVLGLLVLSWLSLWIAAPKEDRLLHFDLMMMMALAGFVLFLPSVLLGGLVAMRLSMKRR